METGLSELVKTVLASRQRNRQRKPGDKKKLVA